LAAYVVRDQQRLERRIGFRPAAESASGDQESRPQVVPGSTPGEDLLNWGESQFGDWFMHDGSFRS
jgi:hypothetical protein